MKKFLFLCVAVLFMFSCFGCAKKETSLEQMQEPVSMEALSDINATAPEARPMPSEIPASSIQPAPVSSKLEPLPPSGPYKPTAREIQEALKNAGYYAGGVDGKIGPKTKKAIEEFQKANQLKADGKVGPKTWAILSTYLAASEPVSKGKGKTR